MSRRRAMFQEWMVLGAAAALAIPATAARAADIVAGGDIGVAYSTDVKGHAGALPLVGGHLGVDGALFGVGIRGNVGSDSFGGREDAFVGSYVSTQGRSGRVEERLSLEGGAHIVSDVGTTFSTPGSSDTAYLTFVGVRGSVGATVVHDLVVGGVVFVAQDLGTQQVTATLHDSCWLLCDPPRPYDKTFKVGGTTLGASVTIEYRGRVKSRSTSPEPSEPPADNRPRMCRDIKDFREHRNCIVPSNQPLTEQQ